MHHALTGETYLNSRVLDHILAVLDKKGVAYWWEGPIDEFVPSFLLEVDANLSNWRKGSDTMDVWFDSGSSWSFLPDCKDAQPRADVCLEGSDQHRGWFQSQLLTFVGTANVDVDKKAMAPYGTLLTHGMVLDASGKKMSKSLGNIISPMTIVKGGVVRRHLVLVHVCLKIVVEFETACVWRRHASSMGCDGRVLARHIVWSQDH